MDAALAIIGFGEAGSAFVSGWPVRPAGLRVYDRKTDDPATRAAKRAEYETHDVAGSESAVQAVSGAGAVLSLVTADQALACAHACAPHLAPGAFWFDLNSVAPDTKRAAARAITAAGARYIDVAVMAPVHPAGAAVPLLVCGAEAERGAGMLREIGFAKVRVVPGEVGRASAIKMIRSVMVKGIEALTAECVLAAAEAGVLDEVLASLDASPPPPDWARRADYNLDRMMLHGGRRAAEMEEVVRTLDALGTGSVMSRGTVQRQRAIGGLSEVPVEGLSAKIAALRGRAHARKAEAA